MKHIIDFIKEKKENSQSQSFVHLVDENGNKTEMRNTEWQEYRKSINESNGKLKVDIEWYRSHGYTQAEDVFKNIESKKND